MQFTAPTTKTAMYAVLKEIYHYYRIEKGVYQEPELPELTLARLDFTPLSNAELEQKAVDLLAPAQRLRLMNKKDELSERLKKLQKDYDNAENDRIKAVESIENFYSSAVVKAEREAGKKGILNSDVIINKIALLNSQMAQKIATANQKASDKKGEISSEIFAVNGMLEDVDTYYADLDQEEITAKKIELKGEQDKTVMEVFKYNNGLDEKEQRASLNYKTTLKRLELTYKEISATELTKDQLVEMGYYNDVMDCVCSYYDLLPANDAFRDISNETKLAIYLDDYYESIIYMYRVRSGN